MNAEGRGGEIKVPSSTLRDLRLGPYGELIVNFVGVGNHFEASRNNRVFNISNTIVAANNATFALPLAATSTPILALVNPIGSGKAASILHGSLAINPAAATALAIPSWAAAPNSGAITTAPANTVITSGRLDGSSSSVMKGYSNVALTGLTNPTTLRPWLSQNAAQNSSVISSVFAEETEGTIIVPPGGILAIMFSATLAAAGTILAGIQYAEIDWPLV